MFKWVSSKLWELCQGPVWQSRARRAARWVVTAAVFAVVYCIPELASPMAIAATVVLERPGKRRSA